jgi:hypothetical protein
MRLINLTQGKVAIIDDCDYPEAMNYKWFAVASKNTWYACSFKRKALVNGKRVRMKMHWIAFPKKNGFVVDHINRNGLDNRRSNLRYVTNQQNSLNSTPVTHSSKYRGVFWDKSKNIWSVSIKKNQKRFNLGRYKDEDLAGTVYDISAIKLFGDFANLNFPREFYGS